jgi:outer membrane murein-binding lipoprotein Lpp
MTRWRSAFALGVGILTFAGAVISMIRAVDRKLSDIDAKIQKLDSAVRTLNAQQPDEKFKDLVKQLLAAQQEQSPAVGALSGKAYAAKRSAPVHTFGQSSGADSGASANAPREKPP